MNLLSLLFYSCFGIRPVRLIVIYLFQFCGCATYPPDMKFDAGSFGQDYYLMNSKKHAEEA